MTRRSTQRASYTALSILCGVQEQRQTWALGSSVLELSQAAAWDARTQHFYAVASVGTGAAKAAVRSSQCLLSWPASFRGSLENAPASLELRSAVQAIHPIFPAASVSQPSSAGDLAHGRTVIEEQHNSSNGTPEEAAGVTASLLKRQVGHAVPPGI